MAELVYFNSIKVQLIPACQTTCLAQCFRFQFHKGTINTAYLGIVTAGAYLFQFHKGTINTCHHIHDMLWLCSFQFHKGTINTTIF